MFFIMGSEESEPRAVGKARGGDRTTDTEDCEAAQGQLLGGLCLNWAVSSLERTQNPDWVNQNMAHIKDGSGFRHRWLQDPNNVPRVAGPFLLCLGWLHSAVPSGDYQQRPSLQHQVQCQGQCSSLQRMGLSHVGPN